MSESIMKKRNKNRIVIHETDPGKPLSARQQRDLDRLAKMSDDSVDTSDAPELPAGSWKNAVRGKWYRPVKQAVSIRLDADVLAWLKAKGKGYQTKVNGLLRATMLREVSKRQSPR
jgi:uncharacterized protein (DUF4415 family)